MLEIKNFAAFAVADAFITYENEETVVEYIVATFKGVIKVSDKEDVIKSITYESDSDDKGTERNIADLTNLLADNLITLSDADFKAFAIENYDSNFTYED